MIATLPLPVLNAHRGDIQQREAEKMRAVLDLQALDVQIQLDVEAALARLKHARAWADTYEQDVLPDLEKSLNEVRQLFASGDASVDALRILDVQRKLLLARNGLARRPVRGAPGRRRPSRRPGRPVDCGRPLPRPIRSSMPTPPESSHPGDAP